MTSKLDQVGRFSEYYVLNTVNYPNFIHKIPNVDIDPSGKFKYILIEVRDPETKSEKLIVRGYKSCSYHVDIFRRVENDINKFKCRASCVGGGRILHTPDKKAIFVYGYSQGFGQADHSLATKLLKAHYPDYTDISWSNEGY